jgi:hyperosmotically inducible periplasmic protein
MKTKTPLLGLGMMVAIASASVENAWASEPQLERMEKQVRYELNMIPYLSAFDYMAFTVDANGNVTLTGQVMNPVVKSDAGSVVKKIEGVEHVNNQIQVLPLSFADDDLRVLLFRTIYGYPTLLKYALGSVSPIRIIVENGHVTLMGVVDSETDKNLVGMRANEVPGVFSVDNQLTVVKG